MTNQSKENIVQLDFSPEKSVNSSVKKKVADLDWKKKDDEVVKEVLLKTVTKKEMQEDKDRIRQAISESKKVKENEDEN